MQNASCAREWLVNFAFQAEQRHLPTNATQSLDVEIGRLWRKHVALVENMHLESQPRMPL
jgi:hypothetical protein